jgi:lipid-binding SYLF domain-containing protein
MTKIGRQAAALVALVLFALSTPISARADQEHLDLIAESIQALNQYFDQEEWAGVKNMIGAAKAIIVVPDFKSGALIVGYERGSGVILTRHGVAWSDPAFVALSQRSVGFQVGVKESELLMLVLTRSAVNDLIEGVGRVGGTGGFALGNLGVGASAAGGISGGMQILTVSLSEGLALGSGIADMTISSRDELNSAAYGAEFTLSEVLGKKGGSLAASDSIRNLLADVVKASWRE